MDANCEHCCLLLSAAMDGETNPAEEAFIRQHLATCPECQATETAYRQLRTQMRGLSHPVPPPQLRGAVMSRVRGEKRSGLGRGQRLALGVLGLLVVLFGGLIILGIIQNNPSFQVEGQPLAVTGSQTIVVNFNRQLDASFIMANAEKLDLFSVKDADGHPLKIDFSSIKVEGNKVELSVKDRLKDNQPIEVVVKPEVKDSNGAALNNTVQRTTKSATPTPSPVATTVGLTTTAPPTNTPLPSITPTVGTPTTLVTATSGPTSPATTPLPATTSGATPTVTGSPSVTTTVTVSPTLTTTPTVTTTVGVTPSLTTTPPVTGTVTVTPTITTEATPGVTVQVTPTLTAIPTITTTITSTSRAGSGTTPAAVATATAIITPNLTPTSLPVSPSLALASDAYIEIMWRGFSDFYNVPQFFSF
jgi:hypothetical protein